jgi:hypothetical protein
MPAEISGFNLGVVRRIMWCISSNKNCGGREKAVAG